MVFEIDFREKDGLTDSTFSKNNQTQVIVFGNKEETLKSLILK